MEKEIFEVETVEEETVKGKKKAETETKSFRASKETMSKLNELLDAAGLNGGYGKGEETMGYFVTLMEMDMARRAVPKSAEMIERFSKNIEALQKAFLLALEHKEMAEEEAENRVFKKIEMKDNTIADYQAKNAEQKKEIEEQKAEIERLKAEVKKAEKNATDADKKAQNADEALSATKSSLSATNALLEAKNAEIERLSAEVATIPAMKAELEEIRKENSSLRAAKESAERDLQTAKEAAERTKRDADRDIQIAKKVFENEKKGAILETKEAYISKIEKKDNEISAMKEKVAEVQRDQMLAKLSAKEEIARLQKEIEELKNASEQKKLDL